MNIIISPSVRPRYKLFITGADPSGTLPPLSEVTVVVRLSGSVHNVVKIVVLL
jgi:hypothetical protein